MSRLGEGESCVSWGEYMEHIYLSYYALGGGGGGVDGTIAPLK